MKKPTAYIAPTVDMGDLARTATYVGSPEHKIGRWWAGQGSAPGPDGGLKRPKKQLTTVCPLRNEQDRGRATGWIRDALLAGRWLFVEGDKRFPKHVWHLDSDGACWIGRCVNSVQGEYKGWPAELDDIATLEHKRKEAKP